MTDRSGPLGDWRVVLASGVAVLSASVITVVARTSDPATADSYLQETRDAAVVLANGSMLTATDGMRVPDGATVKTGAQGAARITTAGRDVYLGALTSVHLVDGVTQDLERGQVMVDSRDAPHLGLGTREGQTAVTAGSLVRVEMGPVLRVGVFDGSAVVTPVGRLATTKVPELYQVLAPYVGLPDKVTPLALTPNDVWEQRLASELVSADRDLNALARGLTGADGTTVLQAAPVALRQVVPSTADRGEEALRVAVSEASQRSALLQDTLTFVQTARDEGGSWGVVAALVNSRVTAVSALLDTVLAPPGPTPGVVAGRSPAPLPGLLSPQPSPGPSGGPQGGSVGPTTQPTSAHPNPSRTASPRPTAPSPTQPADDLVTTVMKLLSPSPSPGTKTAPTPTSLIHLGG